MHRDNPNELVLRLGWINGYLVIREHRLEYWLFVAVVDSNSISDVMWIFSKNISSINIHTWGPYHSHRIYISHSTNIVVREHDDYFILFGREKISLNTSTQRESKHQKNIFFSSLYAYSFLHKLNLFGVSRSRIRCSELFYHVSRLLMPTICLFYKRKHIS